ncbi:MAG: MerR family transcriptional regulator [Muribaculaceae bacterium]|nr:MerR family transcriptional regulator [Muribaculaceae bacterium]
MNNSLTKKYYKIGEAAEILKESLTTLRYWEKEFPELEPKRTIHNRRYYNQSHMELLQVIKYLLREKGMKIESAREQIRKNRKNISKKLEIIEKMEKVREDLELMLQSLNLRAQKLGLPEESDLL